MSIDRQIYDHVKTLLSKDSIVIDIGAYCGRSGRNLCERSGGTPSNYHLIEACPKNFKILAENTKGYNLYHLAIGDSVGVAEFHTFDRDKSIGSSQSNSLYKEFIEDRGEVTTFNVPMKDIDSFMGDAELDTVDFIKINCEGGEYKIFEAETLGFLNRTKIMYLQMHGNCPLFLREEIVQKKIDIIDHVERAGFKLVIGETTSEVRTTTKHTHQLFVKL